MRSAHTSRFEAVALEFCGRSQLTPHSELCFYLIPFNFLDFIRIKLIFLIFNLSNSFFDYGDLS